MIKEIVCNGIHAKDLESLLEQEDLKNPSNIDIVGISKSFSKTKSNEKTAEIIFKVLKMLEEDNCSTFDNETFKTTCGIFG